MQYVDHLKITKTIHWVYSRSMLRGKCQVNLTVCVCQLVASCLGLVARMTNWLTQCDDMTAWWVGHVMRLLWRVDRVTSWSCDELTGSLLLTGPRSSLCASSTTTLFSHPKKTLLLQSSLVILWLPKAPQVNGKQTLTLLSLLCCGPSFSALKLWWILWHPEK